MRKYMIYYLIIQLFLTDMMNLSDGVRFSCASGSGAAIFL